MRNTWRLYGGWYDGNPAELKPARPTRLAVEVATMAGGADVLARRAIELAVVGDDESLRLAGHLAEYGGTRRARLGHHASRSGRGVPPCAPRPSRR